MFYSVLFSFSRFLSVSCHISGPTVCISLFSWFFFVSHHFPNLQCVFHILHIFPCFSPYSRSCHFPRLSLFLTYSRSYCVCFSFFTFFSGSRHIPGPIRFFSQFSSLSVLLPNSCSYSFRLSFFRFFSVSRHIPGHTVFASHFSRFSSFLPKSWSYIV